MLRTNWDIVGSRGSVKEASRKWWRLSIAHARKADYVFAVIDDIVQDIFKINKITEEKYNGTDCLNFMGERVVFDFSPAPEAIVSIVLCKVFQLFCTSSIFFYAATPGFLDVA